MIKAIIIDDERHCIDTLANVINEYCADLEIIAECRSAKRALETLHSLHPDLIFLDVDMPTMNGFEMLEQFSEISFAIIFTTGYDQYVIKAIHFSALDYLLKPIGLNELRSAVRKVQERRHLPIAEQFQMLLRQIQSREYKFNKLAVPTAEGFELVPADQVVHCEASDNYTHIYIKNGKKIIACRTLKEIEEQLQDFNFFIRVHHSHLINAHEVVEYVKSDGGHLVLSNGTSVHVSQLRKEMLLHKLLPHKSGT